jgi:hypothetical protein
MTDEGSDSFIGHVFNQPGVYPLGGVTLFPPPLLVFDQPLLDRIDKHVHD